MGTDMDTTDWNGLVAKARTGDEQAMEDLLAAISPLVLRRCVRFLPYRPDAEEAAQDVLLTIATRLHTYTGRGSFPGWVTVVASNQSLQTYRTMRKRFMDTNFEDEAAYADPRTTSVIVGTRLDIMDAIEQLGIDHPATVEPFMLRDFSQLTYEEIAVLTNSPVGTAKARVHTARKYLRARISRLATTL